jgi:hypothetical protein
MAQIVLFGSDRPATPEELAAALFRPTLVIPAGKSKTVKGPAVSHSVLLDVVGGIIVDWVDTTLDLNRTYVPVAQIVVQFVKILEDVGVPNVREELRLEGLDVYLDALPVRLVEEGVDV